MQLVTLDASKSSDAVRSALARIQQHKQKTIMAIAAVIFAGLIGADLLSRSTAVSPDVLFLQAAICVVAAVFFYRSRGKGHEVVGEFFRFLGFEGKRARGPTAYSQWIGTGIGAYVQLPYYGRSLADILSWIDSYRLSSCGPRYRLFSASDGRTILGILLFSLAATCYLATPIYFLMFIVARRGDPAGWAGFIGVLVLFISGQQALKFGRRMMQPPAEKLLAEDSRNPVLWLRAFRDDRTSLSSMDQLSFEQDRSLEENVAFDLWYYGPLIAVGAPGERLPPVGAARGYFADTDWQNAVRHWMSLARLIVVVVGTTDWLRWEVETAMNVECLMKVLFVFPPDTASNRAARWLNTIMPLQSHDKYKELSTLDVTFARIGHFRNDDTFVLITDVTKDNVAYEVASRLALYGMLQAQDPNTSRFG